MPGILPSETTQPRIEDVIFLLHSDDLEATIVIKGVKTASLLQDIADVFCGVYDDSPLAAMLRGRFGMHKFKWYCLDMSSEVFKITFSNASNPETFTYRGVITQIAENDRAQFVLYAQDIDVVGPGRRRARAHEHFIDTQPQVEG